MRLARIVIGMDFSVGAVAAARWTARELAPAAELVLVYCGAPRGDVLPLPRGAATARLQTLTADLAPALVRVAVRTGDPADGLAAMAEEVEADLIVIGPHGAPAGSDEIGSTAERLVRRSRVPVLLAAGGLRGRPHRVLVPLAADDVSPAVLEWTRVLEAPSGVKIAVVHLADEARRTSSPWRATSTSHRWPRLGDDCVPGGFFVDAALGAPADVVGENVERFASDLVVLDGGAVGPAGGSMGAFLRRASCAVLVTAGEVGSEFP